ncbi:MAG TPA: LacI family DNA-binding transcriptional regulator [Clostridiales bacterium]|nr:LacI family DNA-binding transcriptional regulator [Clostridiales bacterium]
MAKLTIKEIAKMAGVSPTAVSFVINNREGVSEETRKIVREVLERTNFQPSLNSRRLLLNKSFNISIVIRKTSSPFDDLFYLEIAKGLLEKSKEYGYNIVFTDISIENGRAILPDIIKNEDTDGIVFFQDTEDIILNEINKLDIPYVIADAHNSENSASSEKPDILNNSTSSGASFSDITSVNADYELAAYTAVRYLTSNGHKDIAYISSSFVPNFYLHTFEGYKRALEQAQVSVQPSWIQVNAINEDSAYNCMKAILKSKFKPTAVFCTTDMFAIGAIKCAKDSGYKVPEDISFISIDDIFLANYIEPKLTTIRIDKFKMGTLAMELIIDKIEGKSTESITVDSDNLVIRESVKKLA